MEDQLSILNVLTPDCLSYIFPYLRIKDLFRFSQVCTTSKEMTETFCVFKSKENVTTLTLAQTPIVISPPWREGEDLPPRGGKYAWLKLPDCEIKYALYRGTEHYPGDFEYVELQTNDIYMYVNIVGDDSHIEVELRGHTNPHNMKHSVDARGRFRVESYDKMEIQAYMLLPLIERYLEDVSDWADYCRK